jgi:hypothetical protein
MNARHRYPAMKAATCAMPGIPYRPAAPRSTELAVSSVFGKKQGITTINEYDDASLEKAVRRSEELAQLAPENPEYMPSFRPRPMGPSRRPSSRLRRPSPLAQRADLCGQKPADSKDSGLTAAGYLEHSAGFSAMMNSHGLFAYNTQTGVDFSITMRTSDGTGSGYSSKGYNDISQLDVLAHRRLPPGRPLTPAAPAHWSRANTPSSSSRRQASSCWKISMDHWTPAARTKAVVS